LTSSAWSRMSSPVNLPEYGIVGKGGTEGIEEAPSRPAALL